MSSAQGISKRLSLKDIADIVMEITGVQLGEKQMHMVESRIAKRVREVGLQNFEQYEEYFKKNRSHEVDELVALLTTHHTYFFREFIHFEFISEKLIEPLIQIARKRSDKTIHVWSAACSHGHEVYSLGMFFDYYLSQKAPDIKFKILGTDVDPKSVKIASNGVYRKEEINEIPMHFLADHWVRGTGEVSNFVKIKKKIKDCVEFKVLNLQTLSEKEVGRKFDLIFCRNVFIYFTMKDIKKITQSMLDLIYDGGHLFLGISESLNGLSLPVYSLGPSIYSKTPPAILQKMPLRAGEKVEMSSTSKLLRVICVDDSASILLLMKKILTKEKGFEIVATAVNGLEAAEKLKTIPADVMTLDIHMPEQTGIEYLRKNFKSGHPQVLMVSSVSREDQELATQALQLGATDFVEKPTLNDFEKRAEEIRNKLKSAFMLKSDTQPVKKSEIDKVFQKTLTITNPSGKLHIIILNSSNKGRLSSYIKELGNLHPPVFILFDDMLPLISFRSLLEHSLNKKVHLMDAEGHLFLADRVALGSVQSQMTALTFLTKTHPTVISIIGEIESSTCEKIKKMHHPYVIVEEGVKKSLQLNIAKELMPFTSFAYTVIKHFSNKV